MVISSVERAASDLPLIFSSSSLCTDLRASSHSSASFVFPTLSFLLFNQPMSNVPSPPPDMDPFRPPDCFESDVFGIVPLLGPSDGAARADGLSLIVAVDVASLGMICASPRALIWRCSLSSRDDSIEKYCDVAAVNDSFCCSIDSGLEIPTSSCWELVCVKAFTARPAD